MQQMMTCASLLLNDGVPVVPGSYVDVPFDGYLSVDAASKSRLSYLKRSALHMKAYMDAPAPSTAPQMRGKATHAAILEPVLFDRLFVPGPEGDRRTKAVKDAWTSLELERGPGNVLPPDLYSRCVRMRDSVYSHSTAAALLTGVSAGPREVSDFAIDPKTGIWVKTRLDAKWGDDCILDVKTTTNAHPEEFRRTAYRFGYHLQDHLYRYVEHLIHGNDPSFVFIVVEEEAPFAVSVVEFDAAARRSAAATVDALLAQYARCKQSGVYPGYSQGIEWISLPGYAD